MGPQYTIFHELYLFEALTQSGKHSCLSFWITLLQHICYNIDCGIGFVHLQYSIWCSIYQSVFVSINLPILPVYPGSSPQYSKGTYIPVFPTKERQSSWDGRITNKSDNEITMGITPAANCIVGKYHMYVAVMTPHGIRRTKRDNSHDLYILFNPWAAGLLAPHNQKSCRSIKPPSCTMKIWFLSLMFTNIHINFCLPSDDAVFLDDEEERKECVMNEMGIIYHGSYDDIAERNWNYGQVAEKSISFGTGTSVLVTLGFVT